VDDRALNRTVWERLVAALPPAGQLSQPLQVFEVGAGIGTMVERFLAWLPARAIAYTALDALPENIAAAGRRLPVWAAAHGFSTAQDASGRVLLARDPPDGSPGAPFGQVTWVAADLFDDAARPRGLADLLIAHAFLDLMDVPATLPTLFSLLQPGGLFYFTIVFDGATIFEPVIDPVFDAHVEVLYHRTMDERLAGGRPSGDSRCGRRMFGHLAAAGATLLAAGASDWVVYPASGGYPADEAYFLHFIVQTVATALAGHPQLDPDRFARWVSARHAQIEAGELTYIAHQMDFLGRSRVDDP
jgi:hypothetical protein